MDSVQAAQFAGMKDAADTPAVSVVIPAYNASNYIAAALKSVFAQTFNDFEVILVNDGSSDTDELEYAIAPYIDRLFYIKQKNLGPGGARNTAISQARGTYIAMLDSDDSWLPHYLAEQIRFLKESPQLDLVYADAWLFGDSVLKGRTFMETAPSRGPVTFESLLTYQSSILTSCTVVRRQVIVEAGVFDEQFIRCEDFDLWIRLAHLGRHLSYQRQILALHRVHAQSLAADTIKMVESQIEVLKKAQRTLHLSPRERELIAGQLLNCDAQINLEEAKRRFMAGDYQNAVQSLKRANGFYRSRKLRMAHWALCSTPSILRFVYRMLQNFPPRNQALMHKMDQK